MGLHTLLGANGTIANALLPLLKSNNKQIRLVSRNPKPVEGTETMAANLLNREAVMKAVEGSEIVFLLVGITYNAKVWQAEWPVIIQNVIDACKAANAKLVFFDNVYMYGKVDGPITEEAPYRPSSKKGAVRARVTETLHCEMKIGNIKAVIARAVDFYGPEVLDKSAPGLLVFDNMRRGKKAQWFINPDVPRSYNYIPDAARALYILSQDDRAYGEVWHLPSVQPALTGRQFVAIAAEYMNASDKIMVLPKWLLKTIGWFSPFMRDAYEMNYQDEFPFQFSSSKFEQRYDFVPTSYEQAIKETAEWFKKL